MTTANTTMTEPLFETERLRVRPWLPEDLDAIHAIYSDPLAMRWVGDGTPLDRDRCREWISVTAANHRSRGYGMCAIVDRDDGRIVGSGGLVHPDGNTVSFGYKTTRGATQYLDVISLTCHNTVAARTRRLIPTPHDLLMPVLLWGNRIANIAEYSYPHPKAGQSRTPQGAH